MNHNARMLNLSTFFWRETPPTAVKAPQWIAWNETFADSLNLPHELTSQDMALNILAGNQTLANVTPFSTSYSGHQFGYFNPQLGDGRAVTLCDVKDIHGETWEIQLKGAGRTPYSRGGDGRSPIGPVLREYLISEYMAAIGVPTTRALAAVATGEWVYREQPEPGAILTRVAQSHLRVGSFQFAAAHGGEKHAKELVEFAIQNYFPELQQQPFPAVALLDEVVNRQAQLIAQWMQVGFIHGVMNTDNMSILGDTIDYGPCAFMDEYKAGQWFSFIDKNGRYRFERQPAIAQWNLSRFAESLLPVHLLSRDTQEQAVDDMKAVIQRFKPLYEEHFYRGMSEKLGFAAGTEASAELIDIVNRYLELLESTHKDYTRSFVFLERWLDSKATPEFFANNQEWQEWYKSWTQLLQKYEISTSQAVELMSRKNPTLIPRNHMIAQAIEEAESSGSLVLFNQLQSVMNNPFDRELVDDSFAKPPTESEKVANTFCGT